MVARNFKAVPGVDSQSDLITFYPAGAGAVQRTVESKLQDVVSVKDFGAKGDGVTNDRPAIQAAVDSVSNGGLVYIPAGTYRLQNSIQINNSNITIAGAGKGATTLLMTDSSPVTSYSAFDIRTSRTNQNISNITIRDLSVNGNKAVTTAANGSGVLVLCDTAHIISNITVSDLQIYDCPGSGILLQGYQNGTHDQYKVTNTIIDKCDISGCDVIGISQFKVDYTTITNNTVKTSGLENITVDVYSYGCIIDSNRLFKHFGGTGNIGVASGDYCVISNNIIDNQSDTTAAANFKTGIALNSKLTGGNGNQEVVISGNVIANCVDYGILCHDDTGQGIAPVGGFIFDGERHGNCVITGNTFSNNGVDVRVEDGTGPSYVYANKLTTFESADPNIGDVRLGTGEIAFNASLAGDQTIAITASDPSWKLVNLANINGRLSTITSNAVNLIVGGYYQFNAKVRITGLNALGVDYCSLAIAHTPTGGSENVFAIFNHDTNVGATANIDDTLEMVLPFAALFTSGTLRLYVRVAAANPGNIIVRGGTGTRLSGFNV